jgi:hypothetical protein
MSSSTEAPAGADSPSKRTVPPGGGSTSFEAAFRDPPTLAADAAALKLEIARALVRAPSLPVDLPAWGLRLLDVAADKRGLDLVLGPEAPLARLRLTARPSSGAPSGAGELVALGARAAEGPPVNIAVERLRPEATRYARQLEVMAERVRGAVTAERWERALAAGRQLMRLPVDVPLGFFRQLVAGIGRPQGLVRTGFNCNQDCGICWQGRDWGRFGSEQVLVWIEDLAAAGARHLIISGGEPTLDPDLERYVRRARALGFDNVTLETNAIQFAKPGAAERFRDAGVSDCFVSLHSGVAEVSDAITRAPGTFVRTVKGIHALLGAGVAVGLNCVMTNEGLDHLGGLPDFIHENFGAHPLLQGVMLSLPTDSFDRDLIPTIIPDPVKLRRILRPTIDRAFALGIRVRGLDGPCGPPLCAFGADPRIASLEPLPESLDFRTYLPACDRCAVRHACFGVRDVQVALYGDACVEPLVAAPQRENGN